MTESYQPEAIESRWQQKWDETQLYRSVVDWEKPKHYALTMLPTPSHRSLDITPQLGFHPTKPALTMP